MNTYQILVFMFRFIEFQCNFYIGTAMKIEVTFDRTAKKQFRDQCVQRLQKFVQQIKNNGAEPSKQKEGQLKDDPQRTHEELRLKFEEILNQKEKKANHNDSRHHKSGSAFKKQSYDEVVHPSAANGVLFDSEREQKSLGKPEQRTVESSRFRGDQQFSIQQMKENVDKIMDKLQKTSKIQMKKQQDIESKVQITNRKLDQIIHFLNQHKLQSNQAESVELSSARSRGQLTDSFMNKFDILAARYGQLKQNSLRGPRNLSRASKSIFSLQSTQQSLTFRHN